MNAKAKPSWMPAIFWLISALISAALRLRSLNGLSGKNATPVLGVLVNCSALRPGNATRLRHAFDAHRDVADLLQQPRRCVRSTRLPAACTPAIRYSLSWIGMKPRRHDLEHQRRWRPAAPRRPRTPRRDGPACATPRPGTLSELRLKKRLNGRNSQPNSAVDQARRRVLGRVVRLEQPRGQRRRQGQRVDRRDHRRDRDGHRELLVELAGHAGQERHRHEHRAQHQRDRDDRAGHFLHRLVRRIQRRQAFLDVALDVLHHHDRVVDHDADRQHQAEQGQRVDREAEQVQRGERADDRHRHRDQRDDRGAPGLQEQDHHQHHQQRWPPAAWSPPP